MNSELPAPRKRFACQTPGCATSCTWAYSCHNERMGQPSHFWPGYALMLLVAFAAIMI